MWATWITVTLLSFASFVVLGLPTVLIKTPAGRGVYFALLTPILTVSMAIVARRLVSAPLGTLHAALDAVMLPDPDDAPPPPGPQSKRWHAQQRHRHDNIPSEAAHEDVAKTQAQARRLAAGFYSLKADLARARGESKELQATIDSLRAAAASATAAAAMDNGGGSRRPSHHDTREMLKTALQPPKGHPRNRAVAVNAEALEQVDSEDLFSCMSEEGELDDDTPASFDASDGPGFGGTHTSGVTVPAGGGGDYLCVPGGPPRDPATGLYPGGRRRNPRYFPRDDLNPGWRPPAFLLDDVRARAAEPPPVVKTLAERMAELNDGQLVKYHRMHALVHEQAWGHLVDEWKILRYLFARDFKVTKAFAMLEKTMEWETEYKPLEAKCSSCAEDPHGHFLQFTGWSLQHNPVAFSSYRYAHDRKDPDTALAHNVQLFEQMKRLMPMGVEKWIVVTDFVSYSHWHDGASKVGKAVVGVLQDHYPERLQMQILVDPPTTFWLLWKVLSPFVDPVTKKKVHMVYTDQEPNIRDVFPTLFPPELAEYFIDFFNFNKQDYAREQEEKKAAKLA